SKSATPSPLRSTPLNIPSPLVSMGLPEGTPRSMSPSPSPGPSSPSPSPPPPPAPHPDAVAASINENKEIERKREPDRIMKTPERVPPRKPTPATISGYLNH